MKTIYISGPIKNMTDGNMDAFDKAEMQLVGLGYDVLNPHKIGEELNLRFFEIGKIPTYEDYLKEDIIQMLTNADTVLVLGGWRQSKGAKLEVAVALACGIKVYFTMVDALAFIDGLKAKFGQSMWVYEEKVRSRLDGTITVPSTEC